MQERGFLTAILFWFAVTGCSRDLSEAPVASSQSSDGDSGASEGGFVGGVAGGSGAGGGGFAGGRGGFGGSVPYSNQSFEGEIDGGYILQPSGEYIERYSGKGGTPLVIKIESQRLPLMPGSHEIGEQLLKLSGSRVRLRGQTHTTVSSGRRDLGGQQGYRHGIPDHVVYFLTVESVEAL